VVWSRCLRRERNVKNLPTISHAVTGDPPGGQNQLCRLKPNQIVFGPISKFTRLAQSGRRRRVALELSALKRNDSIILPKTNFFFVCFIYIPHRPRPLTLIKDMLEHQPWYPRRHWWRRTTNPRRCFGGWLGSPINCRPPAPRPAPPKTTDTAMGSIPRLASEGRTFCPVYARTTDNHGLTRLAVPCHERTGSSGFKGPTLPISGGRLHQPIASGQRRHMRPVSSGAVT